MVDMTRVVVLRCTCCTTISCPALSMSQKKIFLQSESPGGGRDSAKIMVPGQPGDPKKGQKSEAHIHFRHTLFIDFRMPVAFRG